MTDDWNAPLTATRDWCGDCMASLPLNANHKTCPICKGLVLPRPPKDDA